MKHLHETFTDQEFAALSKAKAISGLNWHDFIMLLHNVRFSDGKFIEEAKTK